MNTAFLPGQKKANPFTNEYFPDRDKNKIQ